MRADCPRVRDDLSYYPRTAADGSTTVIVFDPVLNQYHQFDELQAILLKAFDGAQTLAEIAERLTRELDAEIPMDVLRAFVLKVRSMFLLDLASAAAFSADEGERVRRALSLRASETGVRFSRESTGSRSPERRSRPDVRQLFDEALARIDEGDPVQAMRRLHALLEVAPENARAAWLKLELHRAALEARRPAQPWYQLRLELLAPERALDVILARARFLGSPRFLLTLVAGFVLTAAVAFGHLDALMHDVTRVPETILAHPWVLLGTWLLTPWIMIGHETFHGLACRYHGGRVPAIGLMLVFLFIPAAYCDTSATYTFENRWHRVHVAMAGIGWQMLNYPLLLAWYLSCEPGSPWRIIALTGLMECWTSTIFVLIPSLRNDGYYAVSDALGIPNLSAVSTRFWTTRLTRWFLGLRPPEEDLAIASGVGWGVGCYGALNVVLIVWMSLSAYVAVTVPTMTTAFRGPGLLIATVPIVFLLLSPLRRLGSLLRSRWAEVRTSRRAWGTTLVLTGAVAAFLVFPIPRNLVVTFMLPVQGSGWATLESPEAGRLVEVLVREGDEVRAGQPLARLDPSSVLEALSEARSRLTAVELELTEAEGPRGGARVEAARVSASVARRLSALQRTVLSREQRQSKQGLVTTESVEAVRARVASAERGRTEALAHLEDVTAGASDALLATLRLSVSAARAQVSLLEQRLAALELVAPVSGVVAWAAAPRGDLAGRGVVVRQGDLVVRIRTAEQAAAEFEVPLEYAALVAPVQPVRVMLVGSDRAVKTRVATIEEQVSERRLDSERALPTTSAIRRLAGQALAQRASVRIRTEPFDVSAPGGARGEALVSLTPLTGAEWVVWQLKYFVGYFWWSLW